MTDMKVALDPLLEESVADGSVPGVAAVVCGADGVRYEGRAGRVGVEEGAAPVEAETVFRIASMTKAPVSVGALQLLERGAIELDQPVADVLPAFAELPVLEGFDGEEPRLRAPAGQATIGELLTHTAGPARRRRELGAERGRAARGARVLAGRPRRLRDRARLGPAHVGAARGGRA